MIIFGYVVYCLFCFWLIFAYVVTTIVSEGFTGSSGGYKFHIPALVLVGLIWYGAYLWFPFEVSVVQS